MGKLGFVLMPVDEVVVRLECREAGEALVTGNAKGFGELYRGEVRCADMAYLSARNELLERP